MPDSYADKAHSLHGTIIEDKDIPNCPFCGTPPLLSPDRQLAKCPNDACGIGSWWMALTEWCTRAPAQQDSNDK